MSEEVLEGGGSTLEWLGNDRLPRPAGHVVPAYERLLQSAERDEWQREGLKETPVRAARAWAELTGGYHEAAPKLTTFQDSHDEVVVVSPIDFYSLCEHHLLPFHGKAHIAYIPQGQILGLSKFARVVRHFSRKLQVQERLTTQVADYLQEGIGTATWPNGAPGVWSELPIAVVLRAEHLCMSMRGAQVPGAQTTTSVMRGAFREKPEARAEVLGLMEVS